MNKEKIEKVNSIQMLPLYFASLISADTLVSVESCDISEKELLETLEELPKTNLPKEEIEKWADMGNKGLEIIRRDRKTL